MNNTKVGMTALAAVLWMGVVGAWAESSNAPPAEAGNRTRGPGGEARRGVWNERLGGKADGGLQQETQIMKLLGRAEIVKELNLSPEQLQALKTAREDLTRRGLETIRKLEASLVRQVDLLKQDNPDAAALDEAVEASGRLRTELAKLRMQHLVLVLKTISPEQRRKLNALLRDAGERDKKKGADNGRRERVRKMLSDRRAPDGQTNAAAAPP